MKLSDRLHQIMGNDLHHDKFGFCEKCGISTGTVDNIRRGTANLRTDTMLMIAGYYGMTMSELLEGVDSV